MQERPGLAGVFDAIRHEDEQGEYWSARELGALLGYTRYQQFSVVIEKARTACESSGYAVSDHMQDTLQMIEIGKGAQRRVDDARLSRYACYLVVQNSDPAKPLVAAGQTYFAIQTRRAELADELAGLSENDMRLLTREQLAAQNTTLADAAKDAGVSTSREFAVFQDHGYRGLYGGEAARDTATRKGLKPGARILDYMGAEELADNLFRATQTEARLRRQNTQAEAEGEAPMGKDAANDEHHEMGRLVRQFIADQGGTPPEQLPTPDLSIARLQAQQRQLERERAKLLGTLPSGDVIEQALLFDTPGAGTANDAAEPPNTVSKV
jgi:DNA-damage-inducible protein D